MNDIFEHSTDYPIKALEQAAKELSDEQGELAAKLLLSDNRAGAQKLAARLSLRAEKLASERLRIEQMHAYEDSLYREHNYSYIAGIDEVGRGPLFGPVVAAAVVMPKESRILYINDSKKLSAAKREELDILIRKEALAVGVGVEDNSVIDEINILNATKRAMLEAIGSLSLQPDCLVIDAVELSTDIPQHPIISGDANVYGIAAASIVAKVYRDRLITEYAKTYPQYHLEQNKGYGTSEHIAAIERFGASPLHRKSFISGLNFTAAGLGARCEAFAAKYLEERGYFLLAKNYRAAGGEIDLIMKDGETVVFVEIKGRSENALVEASNAVGTAKRARIVAAAKAYLAEHENVLSRFDVLALSYDAAKSVIRSVKYYKNAFSAH